VRRSLLLIAAIGVLLRLVAVIPVHANGPTSDEKDYLVLAHRLAAGQEFVDSDGEYSKRYPLFPAILAALLRVAGDQTWVLYLVNALFGGLTVLLSALLAGRLWGDPGVSRAVAWGVALYPGLVVYGAVLQTESLYIALFLCAFLCAYRVLERPAWWGMVALGLTAGLATLTRAVFLGFFPLLLLLLAVMQRKLSGNVAWKASMDLEELSGTRCIDSRCLAFGKSSGHRKQSLCDRDVEHASRIQGMVPGAGPGHGFR
jgi:4-amino-4-deoxy-L-arabinose transferase-like glycosyltransferase